MLCYGVETQGALLSCETNVSVYRVLCIHRDLFLPECQHHADVTRSFDYRMLWFY